MSAFVVVASGRLAGPLGVVQVGMYQWSSCLGGDAEDTSASQCILPVLDHPVPSRACVWQMLGEQERQELLWAL